MCVWGGIYNSCILSLTPVEVAVLLDPMFSSVCAVQLPSAATKPITLKEESEALYMYCMITVRHISIYECVWIMKVKSECVSNKKKSIALFVDCMA